MSTYINHVINESNTVVFLAAAEIADARLKAIKLDENGKAAVCSVAGEAFMGLGLHITGDAEGKVGAGEGVDILIKNIGYGIAGAAVKAGAALATDAEGNLVEAAAGNFVIGYAMTAAANKGDHIQVQIAKGYFPTGA